MDASESGPSGNEVKIELQIIKRLRVPFKAEHTRYTYFFLSLLWLLSARRFIQQQIFCWPVCMRYMYASRLGHIE